jgi:hypothetical protein
VVVEIIHVYIYNKGVAISGGYGGTLFSKKRVHTLYIYLFCISDKKTLSVTIIFILLYWLMVLRLVLNPIVYAKNKNSLMN